MNHEFWMGVICILGIMGGCIFIWKLAGSLKSIIRYWILSFTGEKYLEKTTWEYTQALKTIEELRKRIVDLEEKTMTEEEKQQREILREQAAKRNKQVAEMYAGTPLAVGSPPLSIYDLLMRGL